MEQTAGENYKMRILLICTSPNNVRVIKSRRMRGAEYVARMRKRRDAYKVLVGKPAGRRHLEDLGLDGSG
jgi:hypothetical protein